ncbi:SGNH/GDSL hydrolase family protein [Streptomyces sp. NPDC007162]|uniref:SGNH/GDSL hydrolase family protein n=1 Tax=Streptomyces sp. NPDC007162 TaxID=3156917 RepID=UPI0033FA8031
MSTAAIAPSAAAPRSAVHYVALGDSFSSGSGAGDNDMSNYCRRSPNAYPALWAREHHPESFRYAACGGAVTADVRAEQVAALDRDTTLVTITIGGNDADFEGVILGCILAPVNAEKCDAALDHSESVIHHELPARLAETYRDIRAHAPHARVVVADYPHLFDANTTCLAATKPRRERMNKMADDADAVIEREAHASGFHFADVRTAFHGHEVCNPGGLSNEWILRIKNDWESYHPTATGQRHGYLPPVSEAIG